MKPKVSLITLGVRDFEKSLAFYRSLGFPVHNFAEGEQFAMLRLEGTWLSLFPRERLAEDATVPHDGSGFPGFSLAHNVGSPEEVNEYMHSLFPVERRGSGACVLGRVFRLFRRPGWFPLGGCL